MRMIGLVRVGADAVLRFTGNGDPVLNFPAAYDHGRKGEDGKKPSQWIEVSCWGKRAESLEQHLKKGMLIEVVLVDVHVETYDKRDGGTGSKLVGRLDDLAFTGKGEERGEAPQQQQQQRQAHRSAQQPATADAFDDSDIPF